MTHEYDPDFVAWWEDTGSKLAGTQPESVKALCYVAWIRGDMHGADTMHEQAKATILRGYARAIQEAR